MKRVLTAPGIILLLCVITQPAYADMNIEKDCMINSGPCMKEIEQDHAGHVHGYQQTRPYAYRQWKV
jgi:hypothetical protein